MRLVLILLILAALALGGFYLFGKSHSDGPLREAAEDIDGAAGDVANETATGGDDASSDAAGALAEGAENVGEDLEAAVDEPADETASDQPE